MLLQVDQSLRWLGTDPMVLMWLFGTHWLHQQPHKLPLYAMKVFFSFLFLSIGLHEKSISIQDSLRERKRERLSLFIQKILILVGCGYHIVRASFMILVTTHLPRKKQKMFLVALMENHTKKSYNLYCQCQRIRFCYYQLVSGD